MCVLAWRLRLKTRPSPNASFTRNPVEGPASKLSHAASRLKTPSPATCRWDGKTGVHGDAWAIRQHAAMLCGGLACCPDPHEPSCIEPSAACVHLIHATPSSNGLAAGKLTSAAPRPQWPPNRCCETTRAWLLPLMLKHCPPVPNARLQPRSMPTQQTSLLSDAWTLLGSMLAVGLGRRSPCLELH